MGGSPHPEPADEEGGEMRVQRTDGAQLVDEHGIAQLQAGASRDLEPGLVQAWNATAFNGAELGYTELYAADDPVQAAGDFFSRSLAALTG